MLRRNQSRPPYLPASRFLTWILRTQPRNHQHQSGDGTKRERAENQT